MLQTDIENISFAETPEKAFAFYQDQGFFIEKNILSDEECEKLIAESSTLENAQNNTFRPQMMPHRTHPIYFEALKKENLKKIMDIIVDGNALGLQTEFFYCKPGTRGFSLHQDNFFVQAPYGAFASAWIALTDTYCEKGGLIVYPESHKEGLLPVKKLSLSHDISQDPNANNEETIVPPQYKALNAVVPKGAVLFIHGHVVHGSNANQSNAWRYVLLNTYIREGEKYRQGNYAQREAIAL